MSEYIVQSSSLTAVANKIREKTGGSAPLEFPDEFITEIGGLASKPAKPNDSILFFSYNPFTLGIFNKTKNWDGTLYYSLDHSSWIEWEGASDLTAGSLNGWYVIYLKGNNISYLNNYVAGELGRFVITGSAVSCVGNMNNVVHETGGYVANWAFQYLFSNCVTVDFDIDLPYAKVGGISYAYMFKNCYSMTKAPDLPSTDLLNTGSNYKGMFQNCISLRSAPSLPATTLSDNCYSYMFEGCSSLKSAPQLPALTVRGYAYAFMFHDCTSLEVAPDLPATTLSGSNTYDSMFAGCTSLVNAPTISATVLNSYCYKEMFKGCTSLKTIPELPVTNLFDYCYRGMFNGCTDLETLPALPATVLKSNCYNEMFRYCSKIKLSTTQTDVYQNEYKIPSSGTGTTATNALANMFAGTGGTFTSTPTINTPYYTSNTVIPAT